MRGGGSGEGEGVTLTSVNCLTWVLKIGQPFLHGFEGKPKGKTPTQKQKAERRRWRKVL